MSADQTEFKRRLEALKHDYLSSLPEKIDEIEAAMIALDADPASAGAREGVESLHHLTHKLAGSGATFGFPEISATAGDIENAAEAMLENGTPLTADLRGRIDGLLTTLRGIADQRPAPAPGPAPPPDAAAAPATVAAHEKTVVMVGADPSRIGQLSADLGRFGFNVESLIDSARPAEEIALLSPLALIVDVPQSEAEERSAETVWRLRQEGALACPVIFVSDDGGLEARLVGVRVGCDAFLVWPVDVNELVDTIDRLTVAETVEPFRVLIVDDDLSTAEHTDLILTDAGMITSVVVDPSKVLDALESFAPELVLLDLYMPGCDGRELAGVIRQQEAYAAIPIVFLSSERDPDKQLGAMSLGADDFLTKTISPEHLIQSVRTRAMRFRTLRTMMIHDSLTGLLNHSATLQFLANEVERARRNEVPLSFAMLDLDHFKSVNDTHGHQVGDQVIKSLATLLKRRLRRVDVIGRMGGEEFGVILAGTPSDRARAVMDEIREAFAEIRHPAAGGEVAVTLSCGIAAFPACGAGPALVEAADRALYAAKGGGRNRVVLHEPGDA